MCIRDRYKNVSRTFFRFDGQADGRTDGFRIAKTALHIMQRGKCLYTDVTDVTHDEVTKKKTSKAVSHQCACCTSIKVATEVQAAACCDATPTQRRQLCATKTIKKKIPPTLWAYFTNGPNVAASIAPTLIRHCIQLHGNKYAAA